MNGSTMLVARVAQPRLASGRSRRIPIGWGLLLGGVVSLGLWAAIAALVLAAFS